MGSIPPGIGITCEKGGYYDNPITVKNNLRTCPRHNQANFSTALCHFFEPEQVVTEDVNEPDLMNVALHNSHQRMQMGPGTVVLDSI